MKPPYLTLLCLLVLSLETGTIAPSHAQIAPVLKISSSSAAEGADVPLCDPASIDVTFTFSDRPAGEQTVSLQFRNTGTTTCRLQGQAGPSFAVDSHSMNVAFCWLCGLNDARLDAWQRSGNQVLLAPEGWAQVNLHWASTGESCQWADWVNFSVQWAKPAGYIFTPSEWPMHICSAVKSSGYRLEDDSRSVGETENTRLIVSVKQTTPIYSDEQATLHVEMAGPTGLAVDTGGCASLYAVQQASEIAARLDPLRVSGSHSRESWTQEQIREDKERAWPSWKKDRLRMCAIPVGQAQADAEVSAAGLPNISHIEWRTAARPGAYPDFLIAATHFTVLDVDSLAPNWGETIEGIHAGLSVDRVSFRVGELVPVHIRWENLNAAKPLAQGECNEPRPALEIQDDQHHVLKTVPMVPMCMGHGWGPFAIQKGKAQRIFTELATASPRDSSNFMRISAVLPGPGVYYLVSVWSPHILDPSTIDAEQTRMMRSEGRVGAAYNVARSLPVRVEVE